MMKKPKHSTEKSQAPSTTAGYIVNLGIIGLAVTLGLVGMNTVVDNVQENAGDEALSSIGQSFANEIERVDVLAVAGGGSPEVKREVTLPELDQGYTVYINHTPSEGGTVSVSSDSGSGSASVNFENRTSMRGINSGIRVSDDNSPTIRHNPSSNEIVIER